MQCGLCPAQMEQPAGTVTVAEYHHPTTVKVEKPICVRCAALIRSAGGQWIMSLRLKQAVDDEPAANPAKGLKP